MNIALRFLLEMAALFFTGRYFYEEGNTILTVVLPLAMMTLWAVFAVPNDRSRSGKTVVSINGKLRLFMETLFFALPVFLLWKQDDHLLSMIFGLLIIIHYIFSLNRIQWLMQQR